MNLILGITGASGMPIAVRAAQFLSKNYDLHTVVSDAAKKVMDYELEDKRSTLKQLEQLSQEFYAEDQLAAPIASGSFQT